MKRRAEYLVQKRDGRREWLRSSKLARSIHRALVLSGATEEWRAIEVATTVLTGLRHKVGVDAVLRTAVLADAVERVLVATGFSTAANRYAEARAELSRRRSMLGTGVLKVPWQCADRSDRSGPTRDSGIVDLSPVNRFHRN